MMDYPPKYLSTPHWPHSETVHRDDSYHLDPEFFVDRHSVITEKLDGGNTCLWNGEVYARSTTAPSHAGWMAMVRKHHGWKTLDSEIDPGQVFYGEDMYGIHSIEYESMKESETFRLFSTRHVYEDKDWFQAWPTVEAMAEFLEVSTVPVVFRGSFGSVDEITKFFQDELKKPSSLGGVREGFVMRTHDGFTAAEFSTHMVKYVRAHHVQTDQHWTRNWQPCKLA